MNDLLTLVCVVAFILVLGFANEYRHYKNRTGGY